MSVDLTAKGPGAGVRTFVWALLLAFVICGTFGFELWPLTGWRLFADDRHQHQVTTHAVVKLADGTTGPNVESIPGLAGTQFVVGRFDQRPKSEQSDLCTTWIAVLGNYGLVDAAVEIVRSDRDLADRVGSRGATPTQTTTYICDATGLHDV